MNIEECKSLLGWVSLNKLYIDTHNECDYHNIHTAIETLLTAYENQQKEIQDLIINQCIYQDTSSCTRSISLKMYTELNNYIGKDKIKAKIEDILNSENGEAIEKLIEWQRLLEKGVING